MEKLKEKYLAIANETKGLKKEIEKLKNWIVDIEGKYKKLIEANKKEKQNLKRITEIKEKLKESVCSAQLPAEQEEIIQRIKGDQLINTKEIDLKKNKELINKVRIELETKQEKLLSSSDEFHEKKLENITVKTVHAWPPNFEVSCPTFECRIRRFGNRSQRFAPNVPTFRQNV